MPLGDRPCQGWSKLFVVSLAKNFGIQGNILSQVFNVLSVFLSISFYLREDEVVRLQRHQAKVPEVSGSDGYQPFFVILWITDHADLLKIQPILLGELGSPSGDCLEKGRPVGRADCKEIDVSGWPRQPVQNANNKTSQTVKLDDFRKNPVNFS
ncbi:MAG TPA: hypothetical protein VM182_05070 [Terriglobia bacterium]|nr:hypothetical protein [Terriglobia bacterium]